MEMTVISCLDDVVKKKMESLSTPETITEQVVANDS